MAQLIIIFRNIYLTELIQSIMDINIRIGKNMKLNGTPTESRIFDIVEKGEKDEFLAYFPEYKELFEIVEEKKNDFNEDLYAVLNTYQNLKEFDLYHLHKDCIDKKEYSQRINEDKIGKKYAPFIYKLLDSDLLKVFIDYQWQHLSREKKLEYLGIKKDKPELDIGE